MMTDSTEGTTPEVTTGETEPKTYDEGYVKELRAEAAKHRTERNEARKAVEDLTTRVKGFEDANKSELQKLADDKARLEQELAARDRDVTEREVKVKVTSAAAKLNIVDPDAAYLLLDLASIDAEDSQGVTKALKALVKEKPYLIRGSAPPTPGVGGPPVKGKKSIDQQYAEMLKGGPKR